ALLPDHWGDLTRLGHSVDSWTRFHVDADILTRMIRFDDRAEAPVPIRGSDLQDPLAGDLRGGDRTKSEEDASRVAHCAFPAVREGVRLKAFGPTFENHQRLRRLAEMYRPRFWSNYCP